MFAVKSISPKQITTRLRSFNYCIRFMSHKNVMTLYGDEASPPVRFVMMTASLLKIELNFKKIDLFLGENKSDLYTKINPLQKVPTLDAGGQAICDSHAIALYLCRRSTNQYIYPKNALARARVDHMLFFNSSLLFPTDKMIFSEYFSGKSLDSGKVGNWRTLLDYLEGQLNDHSWLAGDKMTLCDLCCGATVSSLNLLVPLTDDHIKVVQWMKKLQQLPCYEINSRGLKRLASCIEQFKIISH